MTFPSGLTAAVKGHALICLMLSLFSTLSTRMAVSFFFFSFGLDRPFFQFVKPD